MNVYDDPYERDRRSHPDRSDGRL